MKIRTIEQLSQKLDDEIIWRKKELAAVKALIDNKQYSQGKKKALLRSGVTLLYAHWEGFIKVAANSYLEFVARQHLPYNQLTTNFIALAMKDKLEEAKETNKARVYNKVAAFFMTGLTQRSSIKYENKISTSNLSSSIFREIICMLGLDYSVFESKEVLIDTKLLEKRNNIAHGNYLDLNEEDYDELHSNIIAMMESFRNQIDNCASREQFRCQS